MRIRSLHSCLPVTLIFLTLLLFPVNLWIYELKKNISVPIGWSYFIGWLVLILYLTCGKWLRGPCGRKGLRWVGAETVWLEEAGNPSRSPSPTPESL